MNEAQFAAVGAFATFAVAVLVIGIVAIVIVDSVKSWLSLRSDLMKDVIKLGEVQTALMEANNDLNERLKVIESMKIGR